MQEAKRSNPIAGITRVSKNGDPRSSYWGYEKNTPDPGYFEAGGKGFEPLLADSESAVLPLDEPPQRGLFYHALFD
jgi:hypothetical protein